MRNQSIIFVRNSYRIGTVSVSHRAVSAGSCLYRCCNLYIHEKHDSSSCSLGATTVSYNPRNMAGYWHDTFPPIIFGLFSLLYVECTVDKSKRAPTILVHVRYMLSPVRLWSVVGNARAAYSCGCNFRQFFYGICYPGHR